jgi:hypothetical protein
MSGFKRERDQNTAIYVGETVRCNIWSSDKSDTVDVSTFLSELRQETSSVFRMVKVMEEIAIKNPSRLTSLMIALSQPRPCNQGIISFFATVLCAWDATLFCLCVDV